MSALGRRIELESDEGAIVLRATGDIYEVLLPECDLLATSDDSSTRGDIMILTGSQWGPFTVVAEMGAATPTDDDEWEEVVEFSVRCSGLRVTELVANEPGIDLVTAEGSYRVRVGARGRATGRSMDSSQPEMGKPVEEYFVRVWEAPFTPPMVIRAQAELVESGMASGRLEDEPITQRGLAAAGRIGRDVDDAPKARRLCGVVGEVVVARTIPASREALFERMRFGPTLMPHVPSWFQRMLGPDWDEVGGSIYSSASRDHPDQLSGQRGVVRSTLASEEPPTRRVRRWAWLVPPGDQAVPLAQRVPLFEPDSIVTSTYSEIASLDCEVTQVQIAHAGVPIEWVEDLEDWWVFQLNLLEALSQEQLSI